MKLLIDIGNTRIKWALFDGDALQGMDAVTHRGDSAAIDAMFDRIGAVPDAVITANVAGDRFAALTEQAVLERWNLPVRFAATQPQTDSVQNGYRNFDQLGVDRWLAIIAAVDRYAGPVCIVDAGTAITIDLVAAGGAHQGGYIIPGLDLMRQALGEETGDLRRLAGNERAAGQLKPGCSTTEAISGGSLAAVCCLVGHCVRSLGEPQDTVELVVTGGNAQQLLPYLDGVAHYRPHLVIEGLVLYEFAESAD